MGAITRRLRVETSHLEQRLGQLPHPRAAEGGALSLEDYSRFLLTTSILRGALELELSRSTHVAVRAVWRNEDSKLPFLEHDLSHFAVNRIIVDHATLQAELMAQQIRLAALEDPPALLGYLYAFERSPFSEPSQRAALAEHLHLAGDGVAYLDACGRADEGGAAGLAERMDAAVRDEMDQMSVLLSAERAFQGLEEVLLAVRPPEPERRHPVAVLNYEAGSHAVSDDLREIEAALRAGEASWLRFPYYEARYGKRGMRFTRSDSAWLALLCQHDRALVLKHVFWLGQVLASRGMPRWLLEEHLLLLHAGLAAARPERRERYDRLRDAAEALRGLREAAIPGARARSLAAAFDARVGPELLARLPEAGALMVAAVADERAGIACAVESLASWLADPKRFPPAWVDAVEDTFAAARAS